MIIKPGISTLEKCVEDGCRYILVTMAAKRARMIGDNGEGLAPADSNKAVSLAVAEIAAGKVGYSNAKDGDSDVNDTAEAVNSNEEAADETDTEETNEKAQAEEATAE